MITDIFIRHAEDESADALTAKGREQTERLGDRLLIKYGKPTKIFVNKTGKIKEMAEILSRMAGGVEIQEIDELDD